MKKEISLREKDALLSLISKYEKFYGFNENMDIKENLVAHLIYIISLKEVNHRLKNKKDMKEKTNIISNIINNGKEAFVIKVNFIRNVAEQDKEKLSEEEYNQLIETLDNVVKLFNEI